MIGAGQSVEAFAEGIRLAIVNRKERPFAAFRGDHRRPVKHRAKPGKADGRRLFAMSLPPDRVANIAKLQRGLRILARIMPPAEAEPAPKPASRRVSDAQLREAVAAKRAHGSDVKAARAIGLSRNAFRNRLKRAGERGLS